MPYTKGAHAAIPLPLPLLLLLSLSAAAAFLAPSPLLLARASSAQRTQQQQQQQRAHTMGVISLRAKTTSSAGQGTMQEREGTLLDGRVLHPGSQGPGWFDDRTAAMPVVLPPDEKAGRSKWRMYYYGRPDKMWAKGHNAFLPTGQSGLAESDDGLRWSRVKGPLAGGAVMLPGEKEEDLDAVQIGVTDVIHTEKGDGQGYVMHYLGGSSEPVQMGTAPGMGPLVGFMMRCLTATSNDGVTWTKSAEPLVSPGAEGEWDSLFSSWPRVLPVKEGETDGPWLVTYHALQPPESEGVPARWAAGTAISANKYALGGAVKRGRALEGGPPGSWDERGVGTRHVIHYEGGLVMFYEAVSADGGHSIGLARSEDGGLTWEKMMVPGKSEPGGPVFEARRGSDVPCWDDNVVGTPWVVKMPQGDGYRLYYVGTGTSADNLGTVAIGCAESEGSDITKWRRVGHCS